MHKLLFLAMWVAVGAFAGEVALDKEAGWIKARAHATGHEFETVPQEYEVHVMLDDAGGLTGATFSCKVMDLTTFKKKRDKEMFHWLESDAHPTLGFTMESLENRDGAQVMVGSFHLHEMTQKIEVPITLSVNGDAVTLDGSAVLNTETFGLPIIRKMGFLTVKPEVEVTFHLVGTR